MFQVKYSKKSIQDIQKLKSAKLDKKAKIFPLANG
jgi:hypothetical protein